MPDDELHDLSQWDLEHAQQQAPPKQRRTVVSVAFPSADYQFVGSAAQAVGMRTSEFVRFSALREAHEVAAVFRWGQDRTQTDSNWSVNEEVIASDGAVVRDETTKVAAA
jgi:hypothetical protein